MNLFSTDYFKVAMALFVISLFFVFISEYLYERRARRERQQANTVKKETKNFGNIENFKSHIENVNYLIEFVCRNQYKKVMLPLVQKQRDGMGMIMDDEFDAITAESIRRVIEMISDEYKVEIYKFINKDRFYYLVAETTIEILSDLANQLNEKAIRKMG